MSESEDDSAFQMWAWGLGNALQTTRTPPVQVVLSSEPIGPHPLDASHTVAELGLTVGVWADND